MVHTLSANNCRFAALLWPCPPGYKHSRVTEMRPTFFLHCLALQNWVNSGRERQRQLVFNLLGEVPTVHAPLGGERAPGAVSLLH